jgi:hypothetical protein
MEAKSWRVTACSVQGASHIKSNQPCQDFSEWNRPGGEVLFAAVADGAGSARESLQGAKIACQRAIEWLVKEAQELEGKSEEGLKSIAREAFREAREAVLKEAETSGIELRELACTLILVLATRNFAVACQIGDGAALFLNDQGELRALTRPPAAEYLNETTFLTGEDALEIAQVEYCRDAISSLAIFTDGLQMLALKMPEAKPHHPFFAPLFKFINGTSDDGVRQEQMQKFLSSPRITERADDDLTLLLASLV